MKAEEAATGAADAEVITVTTPRKRRAPTYRPESQSPPLDKRIRLASAGDVFRFMSREIREETREHFVSLALDVRHRVIVRRVLAIGSMTGVEVHPREMFRQAIIDGAAAVIFVHNHPSGDPTPSRQDVELTSRLREVGEICGIPVLDHVIVVAEGFSSLAERNWK